MGKGRRRGREKLETCVSCGRQVPRDKAVEYTRRTTYSTELDNEDDVSYSAFSSSYYCISCAKRRRIFEKKKAQAQRRREREQYG